MEGQWRPTLNTRSNQQLLPGEDVRARRKREFVELVTFGGGAAPAPKIAKRNLYLIPTWQTSHVDDHDVTVVKYVSPLQTYFAKRYTLRNALSFSAKQVKCLSNRLVRGGVSKKGGF